MIITISGRPGSGKSAVASKVAGRLEIPHVSAGDFMRQLADQRGISILELSKSAEGTGEIDHEIDHRTLRLAATGTDFVIDARLGWHFIPDSLKVFLDVAPREAARRVFRAGRGAETENIDLEATTEAIRRRTESERLRYSEHYGLDYTLHGHYDLVIDTSELSVSDVADRIVSRAQSLMSS